MMIGCNRCCENVRAIERESWTRNDKVVCVYVCVFFISIVWFWKSKLKEELHTGINNFLTECFIKILYSRFLISEELLFIFEEDDYA